MTDGPTARDTIAAMPDRLYFTGDDEADALNARDPLALMIGFALDQQVTVPTAFLGPLKLQRRLGHLDAERIAAMDPAELEAAFRERPAVHRFPGAMAKRVQALCAAIAEDYDGLVPDFPTLGNVDSVEALESYQAAKRAHKAAVRAARQAEPA